MSNFKKQTAELRTNKKALAVVTLISLCALGLVLWAFISFGASIAEKRALIHQGIETTGVTTAHSSQFEAVRGGGFEVYQISYTFSPSQTGQHVTQQNVEIDQQHWQDLGVGSKLPVTYLSNNPSENEPTFSTTKVSPSASLVIYIALSFVLMSVLFTVLGKLPRFQQKGFLGLGIFLVSILVSFFLGAQLERLLTRLIAALFLQ
ncbi:MAG TPA: DUF3592 domain-containing protein [Candidatus Microsaccharimonas sp.]|nr:DUF3592 domain-containing protein [Candidatus Microsaccharimonas sp.]